MRRTTGLIVLVLVGVTAAGSISHPLVKKAGVQKSQDSPESFCPQITECWQCAEEHDCAFDASNNTCVYNGQSRSNKGLMNKALIRDAFECSSKPAYVTTLRNCFAGIQGGWDGCRGADNKTFSCATTACNNAFECLKTAEVTHAGEDCRYGREDGVQKCDINFIAIACTLNMLEVSSECLCPSVNNTALNPANSCIECLYNEGVTTNCTAGCKLCGYTDSPGSSTHFGADHCVVCEDDGDEINPAHADCSGTCAPRSSNGGSNKDGMQCSFACHAVCNDGDGGDHDRDQDGRDGGRDGFDCSDIDECWQCAESGECVYDLSRNTCLRRSDGSTNGTFANVGTQCIGRTIPSYLAARDACFTSNNLSANRFESCGREDGGGFFCDTTECSAVWQCLLELEVTHDGEDCRFDRGHVEQCRMPRTAISCHAGDISDNCPCPDIPVNDVEPDESCEECHFSEGIEFGDACAEGCAVCGYTADGVDTSASDRCLKCENEETHEVVPAHGDCSGTCMPRDEAETATKTQCSSPCEGICEVDGGQCGHCLYENGASFDSNCFQGDSISGGCSVCGFGQGEASGRDNCLHCKDESFVVDVRGTSGCAGRCVPRDQATQPIFFHECLETFPCTDQCFGDDDEDTDSGEGASRGCGKCLFLQGAGFDTDCFEGDSANAGCSVCGYGSDIEDRDSCVFCPDDFDLQVMNTDCTGRCVPRDTATSPLFAADCTFDCQSECIDPNFPQFENQRDCGRCLREAGSGFGTDCHTASGSAIQPYYHSGLGMTRAEFCDHFRLNPGGCHVCGSNTPTDSEENCIACENGYELNLIDPFSATGICLPKICVTTPLTTSTSRFDCLYTCLNAFEGGNNDEDTDDGRDENRFDDVCDTIYETLGDHCAVEVAGVEDKCPDQSPSESCCRLLKILEVKSECSTKVSDFARIDPDCPYRPITTTQMATQFCSAVSIDRQNVRFVLGGVSDADMSSSAGRLAMKRAIASLIGVSESQVFIKGYRTTTTKSGGTEVDVEILAEPTQLANLSAQLADTEELVRQYNVAKSDVETEFGVTLSDATSASVEEVEDAEVVVDNSGTQLQLCELEYSDSSCSTELSRQCYNTNGQTCDAVISGVREQTYNLICSAGYAGHDSCCATGGGLGVNSFQTTCGQVTAASESNRVCTTAYSDSSCSTQLQGIELCTTFSQSCADILTLHESFLRDQCGGFNAFGECCDPGTGQSIVITCSSGAAIGFAIALLLPLLASVFRI